MAENGGSAKRRGPLAAVVGAVLAFAAFAALLVYAYDDGRGRGPGADPVVIAPEPGPYKVRPETPGGMAVPDRDKEVYDTIAAAPPGRGGERFAPGPERPVDRPAAPARPASTSAPDAAAGAGAKVHRIQLAALSSRDAVETARRVLAGKHKDLFSGLDFAVRRVDRGGGKGVVFRLQAGPFGSRAEAEAMCAKLAKRKVQCIVAAR